MTEKKITLKIKRDDQIDQEISGNKWRKLKYNLIEAKDIGYSTILTFGGAYSNHIAATAAACKRFGFKSVGIIRGDELNQNSNPTLQKAAEDGMHLKFVSRAEYKRREDLDWLEMLGVAHQAFVIPEGGSNANALEGVAALVDEIDEPFDVLICPVGTGGTLAGLVRGVRDEQTVLGIAALKGENYLDELIEDLLPEHKQGNWSINHHYHFGGYAKYDEALIGFMMSFTEHTGIPLDPIYTGKMVFGLFDLIQKDHFEAGSKLTAIHTGGLQGNVGFNEKFGKNL